MTILLIGEFKDGKLKKVSHELIGAARQIGGDAYAMLLGKGSVDVAREFAGSGVGRVYALDDAALPTYSTEVWTAALAQAVKDSGANVVIFGHTSLGKDVAPRLAARLGVPVLNDLTAITLDGGRIVGTKPLYAGKLIGTVTAESGDPQIVTLRPNVFPAAPFADGTAPEVTKVAPDLSNVASQVVATVPSTSGLVDLKEAAVIISGGRGLGNADAFSLLFDFAKEIGCAVGASRAAVDAGWIDHAFQVGQTGKTVNPALYIAVGISGAIQHLAGMQTSKCIVAINSNENAPIFKVADYGIVADLFQAVPLLKDELKKALGK
jgi:electron transfer flavoprotein alpha subunit